MKAKSGSRRDAVGSLADEFPVLNQVYPDGFSIPNASSARTSSPAHVKTHVFTTTTGREETLRGLLNEAPLTHPVIHQTLVDLLMIRRRSPGICVMDGPSPATAPGRAAYPAREDVLLASADQWRSMPSRRS